MSKALRTIGTIAAGVALVVGAVATANPAFLKLSALTIGTLKTVATVASVVSVAASIGSQITAPKPVARGTPATLVIDVEPPRPYIVGQVMTGGVLRYDNAYGATLNRVPNPFRWQVRVLSGVGPIQGIVSENFDFAAITSYYAGHFNSVQQFGQRPESAALVPPYGAAPGWNTASKLSGCAAVGLNFKFDRDAERFAAGLPVYTALVDGEKVYDPRQDSTYPGGSGACRLGNEATYVFNRNPALHAGTYAYGRFQDGKRLFGLGLSADAIDWPAIVDWANDCDANGWTANLILYEGGSGADLREQRVRNLDDLCAAGGGRWFQAGAQLSFDWHRPRVSLATLTDADILEAGGGTDAVQAVRNRMNGVRPQYISPDHNWQQITADEIIGSTYRTEDGGRARTQVYPLNGVTNAVQAGQLATYAMADSRELGPIDVQASVGWRFYRPGDCITIDSSLMAYQGQAVINQRSLDPVSLAVGLSLKSETPGKHAFALGKTANPPPTPVLLQTPEERDLLASAAMRPRLVDAAEGANVTAPANSNRVPFSGFEPGHTWSVRDNGSGNPIVLAASTASQRRRLNGIVDFTAAGQLVSIGSGRFSVRAGQRLSVSALVEAVGTAEGSWSIGLFLWTSPSTGTFTAADNGFGAVGFNDVRQQGFITVPADGEGELRVYAQSGSAGAISFGVSQPMVSDALPGQDVHPPYTRGTNGADGADITALVVPSLDAMQGFVLNADYLGAIAAGQLPKTVKARRRRGGVDVSDTTTWSIIAANVTANISSAGLVEVTAAAGTGSVTVISVRDGVELRGGFDVTVQLGPPPVGGGTGGTSQSSAVSSIVGNAVWTTVSDDLEIIIGSIGGATLSAPMEFTADGPFVTGMNSFGVQLRWQREVSPGVWAVELTVAETNAYIVEYDASIGVLSESNGTVPCNAVLGGFGVGTTQKFRLQALSGTGATRTTWFFGTAAAVGS